jgi:hypothetical protein
MIIRPLVAGILFCLIIAGTSSVVAQSLSFEPRALDLGAISLDTMAPVRGTINITNHSAEPLRLRQVNVSCGCLRVVESFETIDPGTTKSLVVEARPEDRTERESTKIVTVRLEGEQVHQERIRVRWKTVHPVAANPKSLFFKTMHPGECRTAVVTLQLAEPEENEKLHINSVHATYPFVEAKVVEGTKIQVDVCLPDDYEISRIAELVVEVGSTRRSLPKLHLPLTVSAVGKPVLTNLRSIVLFQRPPQDGKTVRLRAFDRANKPLHIETIQLDDTVILDAEPSPTGTGIAKVLPRPASNQWQALIDITVFPTAPGTRQMLRIELEDSSVDQIEIPVHHAYEQ